MATPAIDVSSLSPDQSAALEQFTAVTNQDVEAAISLLERTQWNVQIAVARFFDGEPTVDPLEAALNEAPRDARRQDTLANGFTASRSSRTSPLRPAPRIVPNPNSDVTWNLAFPLNTLLWILGHPWNLLVRTFRLLSSFIPFLPALLGRLQTTRPSSSSVRRPLKPRDGAARFIREFEEQYGPNQLPFQETGYAQSLDQAKRDLKYLLVILLSPEHDDTAVYVHDTLLSADVVAFLRDQGSNVLLWGGTVQDPEAYQIADAFHASKFPFAALISNTPSGANSGRNYPTSSSGMSIIAPLTGVMPPSKFLSKIRRAMESHTPELNRLRNERAERDANRSIRDQQDTAYERSLARDRERARQKREEEEIRRREEEASRKLEEQRERAIQDNQQWRLWRAGRLQQEPASEDRNAVRVSVRMPNGERLIRRFDGGLDVEEIYAFVDCWDILKSGTESKEASHPTGFNHEYAFRLVSPVPRVVYDVKSSGSIRERVGRSANLMVENIDTEEEND